MNLTHNDIIYCSVTPTRYHIILSSPLDPTIIIYYYIDIIKTIRIQECTCVHIIIVSYTIADNLYNVTKRSLLPHLYTQFTTLRSYDLYTCNLLNIYFMIL